MSKDYRKTSKRRDVDHMGQSMRSKQMDCHASQNVCTISFKAMDSMGVLALKKKKEFMRIFAESA